MLPNKIKAALFFFEIQLKSYTKRLGNQIKYKILFSRINGSTPLEQHIISRMIMLVPTMLIHQQH